MGLLFVFLAWAGQGGGQAFKIPASSKLLVIIAVVLALVGIVLATRKGRRLVRKHVLRWLRQSWASLRTLARSPMKLAALFGGSAGVTLAYVASLFAAVLAFDSDLSFAQVGAVYLGSSIIAAAAPTPGGLGAMEAALVAGLTGVGMDSATAVAAVLSYRLLTYWLPILPGLAQLPLPGASQPDLTGRRVDSGPGPEWPGQPVARHLRFAGAVRPRRCRPRSAGARGAGAGPLAGRRPVRPGAGRARAERRRGSSTRARRPPTAGPASTTCGPGSSRTSSPASRRCGATTSPARAAGTATACRSSSRSRRSWASRTKHEIEAYGIAAFNERCRESVPRYVEDWIALTEPVRRLDRHRATPTGR